MSDLGRLFWRRATPWQEPLENFTTEALAIAISHDFRPMKEALQQVDWSHSPEKDSRPSRLMSTRLWRLTPKPRRRCGRITAWLGISTLCSPPIYEIGNA